MVPETGVYYIALAGHNEFECGLCAVGVVGTDEDSVVSVLDFSGESVFQPGEGHLWKWDANSGALTLKVGFYFLNGDAVRDDIIILPAGSTVLIAGKAKIVNGIDGGIQTSGGGFPTVWVVLISSAATPFYLLGFFSCSQRSSENGAQDEGGRCYSNRKLRCRNTRYDRFYMQQRGLRQFYENCRSP